ncbi:hypothetical protein KAT51_01345 [bacterium]|nr:hypothetical protein [bacterium]
MTETEMQGALPSGAKDKEFKIPASDIESIVITPKSNATQSASSATEGTMAAIDKPLKVDGTELEYVILAPKGFKGEAPEEKKEEKKEEGSEMDKSGEDMNKKMETLSAENQQLQGQVNQMMLSRREDLATQIVELRQKKGLVEEKESSATIESFMKLGESELKILLSDAERLEKVDTEPKAEAKVKLSASGGEGLTDEQKLRQTWFGHKDVPGDE